MGGNNLYDSSVDTYGTIQQAAGMRNVGRPKISTAAKIAPLVFIVVLLGLASVATVLNKDERQMDQDLYAIEEDNLENKKIVWTGQKWIDEATGKPVEMLQRTQNLLMTELVSNAAAGPDYNCCYVSKPGGNAGNNGEVRVVNPSVHMIESGFYCHMALKNVPSSEWPMIRLGSLREAEVTTAKGQADAFLAKNQLHECSKSHKFKAGHLSMLAQ